MNEIVQWKEIFSEVIAEMIQTEAKGPGGRPHYDYILMFKVLIIQRVYSLSDEQTEYQINDRLSFQKKWASESRFFKLP
jgi:hypothetical protein